MIPDLALLLSKFNRFIQHLTRNNAGTIILSLSIYLIFSCIYFPESIYKRLNSSFTQNEIYIQDFVNSKIHAPFVATKNKDEGDHFMKRELRISPYLMGKILHLNAVKLFYLQSISLIFFIAFFFKIVKRQMNNDAGIAFWSVLSILFTYVGNSFNYDTLFYDSFAYLGLLLAIYFFDKKISILILIFSFFVDERAVIPAFILPIYFVLTKFEFDKIPTKFFDLLNVLTLKNKGFYHLAISLIIYTLGRIILYFLFDLRTPVGSNSGVSLGFAFRHGSNMFYAIFYSLKLYLLFPILAIMGLMRRKLILLACCYLLLIIACLLISTSVDDVTRSMSFSFVLILITFQLSNQFNENSKTQKILYLITLIHILVPTSTLLLNLVQIVPWNLFRLF
jgi:hypothetical protein